MALDGIYSYAKEDLELFYKLFENECQQPSISYSSFNNPLRIEFVRKHPNKVNLYKEFCAAANEKYPRLNETPPVIPTLEQLQKDLGFAEPRNKKRCSIM